MASAVSCAGANVRGSVAVAAAAAAAAAADEDEAEEDAEVVDDTGTPRSEASTIAWSLQMNVLASHMPLKQASIAAVCLPLWSHDSILRYTSLLTPFDPE